MTIIAWLVFGLVVGVIANAIDPAPTRNGILGAVVLGILGAVIGGFIASALIGNDLSGFSATSIIVAVLGSLLLLFAGKSVRRV